MQASIQRWLNTIKISDPVQREQAVLLQIMLIGLSIIVSSQFPLHLLCQVLLAVHFVPV